jgi:hypothetical protein
VRITSLPFELDRDEAHGFRVPADEIHGIVRVEPDAILVTFEVEGDADDGFTHMARIPLADVVHIELTGGAVKSPRLMVEVAREEILEALPWADACLCVVRFRRADAVHAQELVTEIEVRMAEVKTRKD